jgi:predicted O-methyltransferase YrrM
MNDAVYEPATAYIIKKWELDIRADMPVHIPDRTRVDIAKLYKELDYRKGAEIGTARGSHAITMIVNNPKVKLYCIDAWSTYDGCNDFTDQDRLNEYHNAARQRLNEYKGIEIINEFSMDAVKRFKDETLDFVYIDANHEFPYVAEDLFYWSKKVRPGGIVAGHDYLNEPRKDGMVQVKEVVHAYTEAFNINPWFVVDKCTQKRAGSFFWVKP